MAGFRLHAIRNLHFRRAANGLKRVQDLTLDVVFELAKFDNGSEFSAILQIT